MFENRVLRQRTVDVTVQDYLNKDNLFHAQFTTKAGNPALVQVMQDNDTGYYDSPREWDNLWTWVTSDRAGYSDIDFRGTKENNFRDRTHHNVDDYVGETRRLSKDFLKHNVVVKLYLYRHSGDYIYSARSVNLPCNVTCKWDSGCMGFAFVSKEKIRKEYGTHKWEDGKDIGVPLKRISKQVMEEAYACLEGEIQTMNMLNAGEVYWFKVVDMMTDEEDSCGGNYAGSRKEIAQQVADFLHGWCDNPSDVAQEMVA